MENQSPKFLKLLAHLVSYVLHPLFIPTYFLFLSEASTKDLNSGCGEKGFDLNSG